MTKMRKIKKKKTSGVLSERFFSLKREILIWILEKNEKKHQVCSVRDIDMYFGEKI